jgi:hypothetical protein
MLAPSPPSRMQMLPQSRVYRYLVNGKLIAVKKVPFPHSDRR